MPEGDDASQIKTVSCLLFPATTSLQSAAELDSQVLLTQIKPSAAASKTQDLIGRISIQQPQPQRSAAKQITASEKARPHRRQERQAIRTYLLHHIPARKSPNSICDSCLVQVYLHRHAISHTSFLSNSILTLPAFTSFNTSIALSHRIRLNSNRTI